MGRRKCRKDDVTFTGIRLGHTGLNSTLFIMKQRESDKCETCGPRETVEHVLFGCRKLITERKRLKDGVVKMGREWSIKGLLELGEKGVGKEGRQGEER